MLYKYVRLGGRWHTPNVLMGISYVDGAPLGWFTQLTPGKYTPTHPLDALLALLAILGTNTHLTLLSWSLRLV